MNDPNQGQNQGQPQAAPVQPPPVLPGPQAPPQAQPAPPVLPPVLLPPPPPAAPVAIPFTLAPGRNDDVLDWTNPAHTKQYYKATSPLDLTEFRQPLQVQSHLEMPRILVQLGHTQRT